MCLDYNAVKYVKSRSYPNDHIFNLDTYIVSGFHSSYRFLKADSPLDRLPPKHCSHQRTLTCNDPFKTLPVSGQDTVVFKIIQPQISHATLSVVLTICFESIKKMIVSRGLELILSVFRRTSISDQHPLI